MKKDVCLKRGKLRVKCSKLLVMTMALFLTVFLIACGEQSNNSTRDIVDLEDNSGRYINKIFEDGELEVESDVVYSKATNYKNETIDLVMDIYQPANDVESNRPVIIWLHGGGLTKGSKNEDTITKYFAKDFARKGYVCINADYRLRDSLDNPSEAMDDAVADVAGIIKWIEENGSAYGMDKTHIAIGGYSAGGFISINFSYQDLNRYSIDKSNIFGVIDLAGDALYKGIVQKDDPPCIIIQGTKDSKSTLSESKKLASSLDSAHIYNVLYTIENLEHDLMPYYNKIMNQITIFLYKSLTGEEISIIEEEDENYEYENVKNRLEDKPYYDVKSIDFNLDGNLDEWSEIEQISLSVLKDVGDQLPDKEDFEGVAMVGWNEAEPTKIFLAAIISDDILENKVILDKKWYLNDCLEIAFDITTDGEVAPITKCVLGTGGNSLSSMANDNNTEYIVMKDNDKYIFEIAIDISKIESSSELNKFFKISVEDIIGFSISYNDCENGERQHQVGWTEGDASSRESFGTLRFK